MKTHKSLSNILVVLCGQGLCWPLWAIMLLPSVSGVQSSFHQGKSLSCVTMPQFTSHFIYCVHSLLMPTPAFSGTPGDACSAMKLPAPFAPFCQAPLLWSNACWWQCTNVGASDGDSNEGGWGRQPDNAVVYWWVKGHVWSGEGAPSRFVWSAPTDLWEMLWSRGRGEHKPKMRDSQTLCWHWKAVCFGGGGANSAWRWLMLRLSGFL